MNNTLSTPITYRNGTAKVSKLPNGCWQWIGHCDRNGYGISGKSASNNEHYAHRSVYTAMRHPIPEGMTLDHLCRNRWCVNPEHLQVVTLKENVRRAPRTKLSPAQVDYIKANLNQGFAELGRMFGVTRQAIFRISKGRSWK